MQLNETSSGGNNEIGHGRALTRVLQRNASCAFQSLDSLSMSATTPTSWCTGPSQAFRLANPDILVVNRGYNS